MVQSPFSWLNILGNGVFNATLLFPFAAMLPSVKGKFGVYSATSLFLLGAGGIVFVFYIGTGATWAAWGTVWFLYLFFLGLDVCWSNVRSQGWRWGLRLALLGLGGCIPIVIAQVETRFSEEEFFVVLQAVGLSLYWAVLLWGRRKIDATGHKSPVQNVTGPLFEWRVRRWCLLVGGGLICLLGGLGTVRAYQHSFYPVSAPAYPGITADTPFLCGEAASVSQTFEGQAVFERLLARVVAHPRKGPPEYGMLALGTSSADWAAIFRESLLAEATAQLFAGPAHSVKWIQYQAALRVYYFARVREQFPALFSASEQIFVQAWFANINRRALTVEWVDWMYGVAFAQWPEGLYENQENGAGLLALLEVEGLTEPALSALNRDYLARNPRGWEARFHNTDDAYGYQLEWLNNAYFQSLYTGVYSDKLQQLSFEWLLLQALPDGQALKYNHPAALSPAGIAYLGAILTEDPQYLWLAGRAVEKLEAEAGYLAAQPGVDAPLFMTGLSPTQGSCLLYADSGLPNQKGPLAPDKIVFRDGWGPEATYALLDLRFTGWHRYKATNTISLVYQETPLVSERLTGASFVWLPAGRSLFRDKRVPRENLNGLLVERVGMDAVLYTLLGLGGPWAQDPPYYAEVVDFQTSAAVDWSHTRLTGWQGRQHDRWIYLYHDHGPLVVLDMAIPLNSQRTALVWHLSTTDDDISDGLRLAQPGAEVHFLTLEDRNIVITTDDTATRTAVSIESVERAQPLFVATLFLGGPWRGADIDIDMHRLLISTDLKEIILSLPEHGLVR